MNPRMTKDEKKIFDKLVTLLRKAGKTKKFSETLAKEILKMKRLTPEFEHYQKIGKKVVRID